MIIGKDTEVLSHIISESLKHEKINVVFEQGEKASFLEPEPFFFTNPYRDFTKYVKDFKPHETPKSKFHK